MLIAIVTSITTKLAIEIAGDSVRGALAERGLLVGTAGDNVLRLAPPLIVTQADVREAVDIIDQQLASMMTAPAS